MESVQDRTKVSSLKRLIRLLDRFQKIDLEILGEVKQVRKESFIITHKLQHMFIPTLEEINLEQVDEKHFKKIHDLLKEIEELEAKVLPKLQQFNLRDKKTEENFKGESKRLHKYFQTQLNPDKGNFFQKIKEAREKLNFLYDIRNNQEYSKEDLVEFMDDLKQKLYELNRLCEELKSFAQLYEKKVEEEPFIQAYNITKSKDYKKSVDKHTNFQRRVKRTEDQIESYRHQNNNLHKELNVKKINCRDDTKILEARVSDNMRIVYAYNPHSKHLKYLKFDTHKLVDNLNRISCTG